MDYACANPPTTCTVGGVRIKTKGENVGRFVPGMTIAIMIATSACIPIEPAPLSVSAGRIEPPGGVTCDGPFAKDTSHDKVVATFGASNVTFEETHTGVEEEAQLATILYPRDPARRLKIFWKDEEARSPPTFILLNDEAQWTAGPQLRLGLGLQQVEALNKKPFRLWSFDSETKPGKVADWRGGALAGVHGGCKLDAQFAPNQEASKEDFRKLKGKTLWSNDPKLQALNPTLDQIFIYYPK